MNQLGLFHTTTQSPEKRLEENVKAGSQTMMVYGFFKQRKEKRFTALEIADKLNLHPNSARRCCTVLFKDYGLLTKLDQMKLERYGKPNHYYTFNA